jgi:hypothetical protein
VAVNKGTFNGSGQLSWGPPTFINQTTAPSTLNDKEWIAADWHVGSPFQDRIYVSWTRFLFNAHNRLVRSGRRFFFAYRPTADKRSANRRISRQCPVRPGLAADRRLRRQRVRDLRRGDPLATLDSTYIVKSTDGGVTFGKPVKVAELQDVIPLANTASGQQLPAVRPRRMAICMSPGRRCCATATVSYARRGRTTVAIRSRFLASRPMAPQPGAHRCDFSGLDAASQTAIGYPVNQPGEARCGADSAPYRYVVAGRSHFACGRRLHVGLRCGRRVAVANLRQRPAPPWGGSPVTRLATTSTMLGLTIS